MIQAKHISAFPISSEAYVTPDIIRLAPREALSLQRQGQHVRIHSGSAWMTHAGGDFFTDAGGILDLGHGREKAVISSADKNPILVEIEE